MQGKEENGKSYICIDLKSFFASVECVERGLDPMTVNLVVADPDRTEKTICLAITPAMKKLGIKNRCRVFEIPANVSYIMAEPRMQLYLEYSARVYEVYLKYISEEDIHVYSVDEAFMDVTHYLKLYGMTPKELGKRIMDDVYETTGLRATCGVGTNMYLTKVALDILAKHAPDFIGVLDEESYKEKLWDHLPLTDFWRIGHGTEKRLAKYGIKTMRQIAATDEAFLYKLFGVNAAMLIDHAWGREPTTMEEVKAYVPETNSFSSGQVLARDYSFSEAKVILREMLDELCLKMVDKGLVTDSVTIHIIYSIEGYAHGTARMPMAVNGDQVIIPAVLELYDEIIDKDRYIRRIYINFNKIKPEGYIQYELFSDTEKLIKDRNIQRAIIDIKKKYGKNAVLKGTNFDEAATGRDRNRQIGGHKGASEGRTVYVDAKV